MIVRAATTEGEINLKLILIARTSWCRCQENRAYTMTSINGSLVRIRACSCYPKLVMWKSSVPKDAAVLMWQWSDGDKNFSFCIYIYIFLAQHQPSNFTGSCSVPVERLCPDLYIAYTYTLANQKSICLRQFVLMSIYLATVHTRSDSITAIIALRRISLKVCCCAFISLSTWLQHGW